jgi:ribonuclease E
MTLPIPSYIAIDASFHWIRTALVEQGVLTDVYEESPERGRLKGNIYKGVVRRIDAKIHAAFIRYGQGRDGFLPLKDAERTGSGSAASKPLKEGDEILVQVLKDEVGEKGAALTTRLSLSGRSLVYLLEKEGEGGVSSRLSEEDRSRLRSVLQELKVPDGSGVILRTAALSKGVADLQADLDRLSLLEKEIRDGFSRRRDPGLLWREAPPITRYLREYWQKTFDKVWVNTEEAFAECRAFFSQHEPEDLHKVELSVHGPALFEQLGLEETLAKLESSKVPLASGANIVIERTEALVSIDVNSARSKGGEAGKEAEENLFRINCEAAAEVARQIRLRDLGGIIVVDFIDMEESGHRAELEALMKSLCSRDKAKVKVYGLSPLGLMEINRQRLRKIPETRELPICPQCHGEGHVEMGEGQALKALRLLAARMSEKPGEWGATLSLSSDAAAHLWNEHRQDLEDLEQRYASRIRLQVHPGSQAGIGFHWAVGAKPVSRVVKALKAPAVKPPLPTSIVPAVSVVPPEIEPNVSRDVEEKPKPRHRHRRARRGGGMSKGAGTVPVTPAVSPRGDAKPTSASDSGAQHQQPEKPRQPSRRPGRGGEGRKPLENATHLKASPSSSQAPGSVDASSAIPPTLAPRSRRRKRRGRRKNSVTHPAG